MNEASLLSLTQALRNNEVEYRVWQTNPGVAPGERDFRVQATSAQAHTADQLNALEQAHSVVASTNRAEFR